MADMQKDLILAPNEYAYVLDETKGNVSCNVGPHKMSLSQSDRLVVFDNRKKKFVPCDRYENAIQLFVTAPEGWYIALKNPAPDNRHPSTGVSNTIPERMQIGCKVNIPGPASFALYPGQMAQVIKGHTLRSNQYLVARVYDAATLNAKEPDTKDNTKYVNGQILIIKGTETSFYIPPTGIEVKAINDNSKDGYVRDAVTLERLEYCILKDENGIKRYVHGPSVVFPKPTESFIQDGNKNIKRNAIELSDISGVYVKVIADYKDEQGKDHKTGEEMFITGKDQMIYYPRPEHTFITYNGRIMHHATAIPKGEGRYIMNRMTGDIKTVRGPAMYLPDPRTEVIVKRTLTRKQCELWYPNNQEVLIANGCYPTISNTDDSYDAYNVLSSMMDNGITFSSNSQSAHPYTKDLIGTPIKMESNKINRSNTYVEPRTISLNSSKYEGAVSIDVWTGYAVNVISKDGSRQVVRGPQTILLDYDQSLETLELSTGKPKTTDNLLPIVFLRHENNRISDIINVETSDFVTAQIKVSYLINFDPAMIDKWFSVDNYVKHLCDFGRSKVKNVVKQYTVTDLCENCHDIVRDALTDSDTGMFHKFEENGMMIFDIEVLSMKVEDQIQEMIDAHQEKIVAKALELNEAQQSAEVESKLRLIQATKEQEIEQLRRERNAEVEKTKRDALNLSIEYAKMQDAEDARSLEIKKQLQSIQDEIFKAKQEQLRIEREAELAQKQSLATIEADREARSAEAMKVILTALGPDLAAALNNSNNRETIEAIAKAISPYALARGENVAEAVSTMLRGTTMEEILSTFDKNK